MVSWSECVPSVCWSLFVGCSCCEVLGDSCELSPASPTGRGKPGQLCVPASPHPSHPQNPPARTGSRAWGRGPPTQRSACPRAGHPPPSGCHCPAARGSCGGLVGGQLGDQSSAPLLADQTVGFCGPPGRTGHNPMSGMGMSHPITCFQPTSPSTWPLAIRMSQHSIPGHVRWKQPHHRAHPHHLALSASMRVVYLAMTSGLSRK